jgi:hypothetical protein
VKNLVSKFAFKFNLYRYIMTPATWLGYNRIQCMSPPKGSVRSDTVGGAYNFNPVVTHTLKAPDFNPCKWKTGFKFCFFKCNLYRYVTAIATSVMVHVSNNGVDFSVVGAVMVAVRLVQLVI